ncbi:hypothetical protein H2201_008047 [Coniosporium apollinis]|uniref:tRNA (adenine(58)-N(1))-methyltransferase catalytic subunit TRM61 n=2 Tax=Coniosporium TaxID=2810619 RepID=A0ABQ9NH88_9PEZI|nr:hypothetical protein H2199_004138 [Cladosporium sp. JES 115]KAJ9657834.1 hypothetical protein H2201_008047 [Coniosporium apollinis]
MSGVAMRRALLAFPRGPQYINICLQCRRKLATDSKVFAEGDIVLLRQKDDPSHVGILTKPLRPSARIETHRGTLPHASIIGRRVRDIVSSSKNVAYRIHEPTLAEYVRLTPRLVTPIYPGDANLIVSLLDIHVSPPGPTDGATPPLEILEAGTGHGALTLHLARAIHAANPRPPPPPKPAPEPPAASDPETISPSAAEDPEDVSYDTPLAEPAGTTADPYEAWRKSRRAVVHTLEISAKHSEQAQRTVSRFRHGVYAQNVDFHVGDVSEWLESQLSSRAAGSTAEQGMPFLSHVFLDLPSAEEKLKLVAKAVRVDGVLAVFNPSITQIGECVTRIKELKLPFQLEQVVELGPPRLWDLRVVRPRSVERLDKARGEKRINIRKDDEGVESVGEDGDVEGSVEGMSDSDVAARDQEQVEDLEKKQEGWKMVCRPKVGERVVGGGFLGVWRRMRDMSADGG